MREDDLSITKGHKSKTSVKILHYYDAKNKDDFKKSYQSTSIIYEFVKL